MKSPPPEVAALGRRLRRARDDKGFTQRQVAQRLADRLGQAFSQAQIHRIESGAREITVRELQHLADVLEVNGASLIANPGGTEGFDLWVEMKAADTELLECLGRAIQDVTNLAEAVAKLSRALDAHAAADPDVDLSDERERLEHARSVAVGMDAVLNGGRA
ncbi:helix-turn-helix domain-containing protein [Isoptericola sp. NPDC057191]|uniref:helix-turn-helix domain-containing protein n=1 Tax=Isoptericola sp. NPDC057191 TaxID=3346041 RepID=UPI00363E6B73